MQTIILPDHCDRAAIEELLPAIRAAAEAGPIRIDAGAVSHAGQALVQLLASARLSQPGCTIVPSPAVATAATLTGLATELFGESGQ